MKIKLNKRLGLIVLVILLLTFPLSLTNQVKLNMRILVTGIAIDKVDDEYEITAQTIYPGGGNQNPGTSAEINFLTGKGDTISKVISNLLYKAGKVSAFSHLSFIVIGNSMAEENVKDLLSVFIRDKVINSSALILLAKENAKDEIKKTKDLELNIGLSLQKVYSYKQDDSDGLMVTILNFMKECGNYGKTSTISLLELEDDKQSQGNGGGSSGGESSSGSSGGSESGGSSSSGGEESGGNSGEGGSGGGESGGGGGSGGSSSQQSSSATSSVSFKSSSNIGCFVDGKVVCTLSEEDEILGYMIGNTKTKKFHLVVENVFGNKKATINVKKKSVKKKVRFENEIPCLDIEIIINNSDIAELLPESNYNSFSNDEYIEIETAIRKTIAEKVSKAFNKAKSSGADIFGAYEIAYKFNYDKVKNFYDFKPEEFIKNLKINVKASIRHLDY